ncbi:MAG TPA: PIN domain-containing protein [Verrucomicrobiae bacterium]|nr:PIN domain-containing protein [Verrucomicrobiae bacterium]
MKVVLDLNVVLDVVQNRAPFYQASAQVLSRARTGEIASTLPTHAVSTIHYVVAKAATKAKADQTVDWLLTHFEIGVADKTVFRRARELNLVDFEDAVVASLAEASQCDYIVTRNLPDFSGSPVAAITPRDLLAILMRANPGTLPIG